MSKSALRWLRTVRVAARAGFILARRLSWVWAPVGLAGSVMLTSSGFVLQTRGFKAGNTVVVCTMAAVASMISGEFTSDRPLLLLVL